MSVTTFKSARKLANGTDWLIEADDFIVCTSKHQVSSLVPLGNRKSTGGYWDDIALAGAVAAQDNNRMAVLGSGLGSFLPLTLSMNASVHLTAVDLSSEYLDIAERVANVCGARDRTLFLHSDAATALDSSLEKFSSIFVDLYSPEGILPLAADPNFHLRLMDHLTPDGLVFINVADRHIDNPELSTTNYFAAALNEIYPTRIMLRRKASSTLVFSKQKERNLMSEISQILGRYPDIWNREAVRAEDLVSTPIKRHLSPLFGFNEQVALSTASAITSGQPAAHERDSVTSEALAAVQQLSRFDLVRLSRKPSELIGVENERSKMVNPS